MPQDVGGEREICLLSESTHHVINATRGQASASLAKKECRFVSLCYELLALFQPGVQCRSHLSIQGNLPVGIALAHAHNYQPFARGKPHIVYGERCTFTDA